MLSVPITKKKMESNKVTKTQIESWIKIALASENIRKLSSVEISGTSEKGQGFMGDILFVDVTAEAAHGSVLYHLVLKCGKKSEALRASAPVREAYENEMYAYNVIFPNFKTFQMQKGLSDIFNSIPKCYGTIMSENTEVLVLENLKCEGYELWDKKKVFTRNHIEIILKEFGKSHAVSVAMREQQPELFKKLAGGTTDIWQIFCEKANFSHHLSKTLREVLDLTKDTLTVKVQQKCERLYEDIGIVLGEMFKINSQGVILHADSWTNNFMFKNTNGVPAKVVILDWQALRCGNPVYDLSHFLYAGSSKDELVDLENVLRIYHDSFSIHLKSLGSNPGKSYPFDQLLDDWKKFGRFGVILSSYALKCNLSDVDNVDIETNAEKGLDFGETFNVEVSDKVSLISRMKDVFEQASEHGAI